MPDDPFDGDATQEAAYKKFLDGEAEKIKKNADSAFQPHVNLDAHKGLYLPKHMDSVGFF